jgi:hypothetical protein
VERRRPASRVRRDLRPRIQRAASGGLDSADAAGCRSIVLLQYDEVASGVVDHAIRVTADCTFDAYVWPARHSAGTNDRRCPPMGAASG